MHWTDTCMSFFLCYFHTSKLRLTEWVMTIHFNVTDISIRHNLLFINRAVEKNRHDLFCYDGNTLDWTKLLLDPNPLDFAVPYTCSVNRNHNPICCLIDKVYLKGIYLGVGSRPHVCPCTLNIYILFSIKKNLTPINDHELIPMSCWYQ